MATVLESAGRMLRERAGDSLSSDDAALRAGAAALVGTAGWVEQAAAVAGLLVDGDRNVADAAEASLRWLSLQCAEAGSSGAREVRDAAAAGVEVWPRHRRSGVLETAAMLLEPGVIAWGGGGEPLARWLLEGTSESHMGLRAALRKSDEPVMRRRAWEWLGRGVMAAAALDRLGVARTAEEHEGVLRRSHLLANPVRARRVGLLRPGADGGRIWAREGGAGLSEEARRGIARVVMATGAAAEVKAGAVRTLLADASPAVRLSAAVASGERDYCFDADERVARHACLRLAPAAGGERELWGKLERSPHLCIRRMAAEEMALEKAWDHRCERSRAAARRLLRRDREAFLAGLRARVGRGESRERAGAIMLGRVLGVQRELELELLEAAARAGEDELVVATAVAALAEGGGASASEAVRRCLRHGAARVRANAAEGVLSGRSRLAVAEEPVLRERVVELKDDPHHRVRANALRGLLAGERPLEPGAAAGLGAMLHDARPLHRLAGLWALERVAVGRAPGGAGAGLDDLTTLLSDMIGHEPEEAVRARAERCAARMLTRMRLAWGERAAAAEVGGVAGVAA